MTTLPQPALWAAAGLPPLALLWYIMAVLQGEALWLYAALATLALAAAMHALLAARLRTGEWARWVAVGLMGSGVAASLGAPLSPAAAAGLGASLASGGVAVLLLTGDLFAGLDEGGDSQLALVEQELELEQEYGPASRRAA